METEYNQLVPTVDSALEAGAKILCTLDIVSQRIATANRSAYLKDYHTQQKADEAYSFFSRHFHNTPGGPAA